MDKEEVAKISSATGLCPPLLMHSASSAARAMSGVGERCAKTPFGECSP